MEDIGLPFAIRRQNPRCKLHFSAERGPTDDRTCQIFLYIDKQGCLGLDRASCLSVLVRLDKANLEAMCLVQACLSGVVTTGRVLWNIFQLGGTQVGINCRENRYSALRLGQGP